MKLKAVVNETCTEALVTALQSTELRSRVIESVLKKHLRMVAFGPAEFYIQHCDLACGGEPMCEVRLTGVSVNTRRSTDDFRNALAALEAIYVAEIERHSGSQQFQLFVSMMLDRPPLGENSSLLERDPIMVPLEKRP